MKKIYLPSSGKELKIEKCEKCSAKMVNVDKDELTEMDIGFLNMIGVRWSNPKTEKPICIRCEIERIYHFSSPKKRDNDDDDNWSRPASPRSILGGFSLGSFGGFSGGGFGGGGASR